MTGRRGFLASMFGVAGGLVLPEPRRVYSFMPALWAPRLWLGRAPGILIVPTAPGNVVTISDQQTAELYGYGAWWREHCAKQVQEAVMFVGIGDRGFNHIRIVTREAPA